MIRIPQYFLPGKIVFISSNAFQQNHQQLGKEVRSYVYQCLLSIYDLLDLSKNSLDSSKKTLCCIGGESYLYGLFIPQVQTIQMITNHKAIAEDVRFHAGIYSKEKEFIVQEIQTYTDPIELIESECLCINVAQISTRMLDTVLNKEFKWIILIHCHPEDFIKKVPPKLAKTSYRIIKRMHFTCSHMHSVISVTLFKIIILLSLP
jgi:hypothetical protein